MSRTKKYDPNLPKNLTYRRRDKAYYWRNPLTKEEFTLGKISRRDAVAQAIEANHYIYKNYSPAALIEKLKGFDSFTMADWIERYKTILIRRKVSRIHCHTSYDMTASKYTEYWRT